MSEKEEHLAARLGTRDVVVAGVALVVAASTLVSDFSGYFTLGWGFVVALILAGIINFLLATSAADLSAAMPRAGALYEYARDIFSGRKGVLIGVILGLSFYIMYGFALSGEIATGAYATQAFLGSDWDVRVFVVILSAMVIVPNVIGVKETALFSLVLLVFMIGIRWFFGLSGLFGWGGFGDWQSANLVPAEGFPTLFGAGGILVGGLALAIWSFVGIEFACSLAEEVHEPRKTMPKGLMVGIGLIAITSMLMGVGVVGTAPLTEWQALAASPAACAGSCTQLAVGELGFGKLGFTLMAVASFTATLGTAAIGLAAMSRVLYAIGRDGLLFGPTVSRFFGHINPKTHTPVNATVFTGLVYIVPGIFNTAVIDLLFTGAYVWILLYVAFHLLSISNRALHPNREFGMGKGYTVFAVIGAFATAIGLYYAFYGVHADYGVKAIMMIAAAAAIGLVSIALRDPAHGHFEREDAPQLD